MSNNAIFSNTYSAFSYSVHTNIVYRSLIWWREKEKERQSQPRAKTKQSAKASQKQPIRTNNE